MNTIHTSGTKFVDELGRERILNGVNIVDKSAYSPGEQKFCLAPDRERLARFREMGIDLIRLGFTWAKLEPVPGEYNDEYLDSVGEFVDMCAEYGIYVFLDMHQDLYSPACNGDGAPAWAALTDKYKVKPIKGVWAEGYFKGKYCQRAFDNFWDNREVDGRGLQDRYALCWAHVAQRFADKPALLGFDLMNEPFPGMEAGKCFRRLVGKGVRIVMFDRHFSRVSLLGALFSKDRVPRILSLITPEVVRKATSVFDRCIENFDKNRYAPFMSKTTKAIRGVTDKGVIIMENSYWSNTTVPFSAPPITVDGLREPAQAFGPHAYDFMVDSPLYKYASNDRAGAMFLQHRISQKRLGVPVIVGEWGGCGGADEDWLPHIEFLLRLFDSNKWSSTYWSYSDGLLDSPLMKVFVRPHPRAAAGDIISYEYDRDKGVFNIVFDCRSGSDTVIYVPQTGIKVKLDGESAEYDRKGRDVIIRTEPGMHVVEITALND